MNRRKGIIAILAAAAGHSAIGQRKEESRPGEPLSVAPSSGRGIDRPYFRKDTYLLCNLVDGDEYGVSSIEVTYGKRRIRLTSAEIMDALEEKPVLKNN